MTILELIKKLPVQASRSIAYRGTLVYWADGGGESGEVCDSEKKNGKQSQQKNIWKYNKANITFVFTENAKHYVLFMSYDKLKYKQYCFAKNVKCEVCGLFLSWESQTGQSKKNCYNLS